MKKQVRQVAFLMAALCGVSATSSVQAERTLSEPPAMAAKAVLSPTQGSQVFGTVRFMPVAEGVKVIAEVSGLTPGEHGFHVHAFGDCSAPDAMSAGGHFNPSHQAHGAPGAGQQHKGDLGNLIADAAGKAHYEMIVKHASLYGADSIIGHAVIVHAQKDDLHSQPAGNAGARVACGVIGFAAP